MGLVDRVGVERGHAGVAGAVQLRGGDGASGVTDVVAGAGGAGMRVVFIVNLLKS
jgi:hypothetical protein